jgi:hypothetical protein
MSGVCTEQEGSAKIVSAPKIETYRFGHLVVDGQAHSKDLIILPDHVVGGWWRQEGHAVHPDDLAVVLVTDPEILIVGQGAYGRMRVTHEASQALQAANIELIAQPTEQACQTYNRMREQGRVAAALHLTC